MNTGDRNRVRLGGDDDDTLARAARLLQQHGFAVERGDTAALAAETERRRAAEAAFRLNEERLDALLALSERHHASVEELAQFAIDEGVRLTRSTIGYLHFVNDAQDGFLHYFWSRGSRETCAAVELMDYTVCTAGIWADALRLRRPVVHNGYPNEPTRRGLPEGHHALSRHMSIPVLRDERVVAICGVANKPAPYDAADLRQLRLLANRLWSIVESQRTTAALEAANAELSRVAGIDALTGVANRRALESFLDRQWRSAAREGTPISLLMLDIDYFKAFNDTYGHQAGDAALKAVGAAAALAARRPADLVARFGGEEFIVVLSGAGEADATAIANGLVERVRALGLVHAGSSCAPVVTVSVGTATRVPQPDAPVDWPALVAAADAALYAAKQGGRNGVRAASALPG